MHNRLKQKDSIENVLEELNLVNDKIDILGQLGGFAFVLEEIDELSKSEKEFIKIIVDILEEIGLKYIRKYVRYCLK